MEINSIVASQVVNESGELVLGDIPLDLGLSQLLESTDAQVVLSDGQVIKLTGSDDDILAVTMDYNFRSRHAVINAYMGGINLSRLRTYLVDICGYSAKEFYQKVTALTGYSRGSLEKRIKMAEGYSKEQMQLLAESGATQATALLLLKASPEKREEVFSEAQEGLRLNHTVVAELLGTDEDDDEADDEAEKVPPKSQKSSGSDGASAPSETAKSVEAKPATDTVIDVEGSFTSYSDLITDTKDYTHQDTPLEQRFNQVIAAIEDSRTKHKLNTVRGEAVRCAMANVLAGVYAIEIPTEIETENEPKWFKVLRDKLPINSKTKEFKALFVMAFIDGHLSVINGEKEPPAAYEDLLETKKKEDVDCLYELWAEGFAQGKQK